MSTFTVSIIIWGIGVITGRIYQYVVDHKQFFNS